MESDRYYETINVKPEVKRRFLESKDIKETASDFLTFLLNLYEGSKVDPDFINSIKSIEVVDSGH